MKTVTIHDVVLASGCSAATVSRVLNGRHAVAAATRAKVEEAIRKLNYRHAAFERRVVAIIHPVYEPNLQFAEGSYPMTLLGALTRELYARNYRVMVVGECDLDLVTPDRFCGAVSMTYSDRISERWSREQPLPLVIVNSPRRPHDQVYSIVSDDGQGIELAVEHLYRRGHRNIGFLQVTDVEWSQSIREDAFRRAMERRNLDSSRLRTVSFNPFLYEPLGVLVHSNATALLVAAEGAGHRVLSALSLFRLRVPDDLSLVCWEAANISECTFPPLTTVGQDFAAIGRCAADCLDAFLAGKPSEMQFRIPYRLTARESVKEL